MTAVQDMLSSKSKVLFFTIRHYDGYANGLEFRFFPYKGYRSRLLAPVVKGQVRNDHPTVVDLEFQPPIIPAVFLLVFPLMFLPLFFSTDAMTINGVLREPTMNERIGWGLFFIGVPASIYYLNFILPLLKLHRVLRKKLRLEDTV
jgi:hypothetical protein